MMAPREVRSLDNPLVRDIRALQRHPTGYRSLGRVWLEGDHVLEAWCSRWSGMATAVVSDRHVDSLQNQKILGSVTDVVVVPQDLFSKLSDLPSPSGIGVLMALAPTRGIDPEQPSVVIDRLQDTGNVGSIIRSAAAFGYTQVIALRGSAALWSPKCLRSAAGAHASVRLVEEQDVSDLEVLRWPLCVTSSHGGHGLHDSDLTLPVNWVFSHEGQGVSPPLQRLSQRQICIEHTGGQESLNVAAAAAICLYVARLPVAR